MTSTNPATSPASVIRNIDDLRGPAGRLEGLLNSGSSNAAYAAVVAHPHPVFGGTMHNKVVYHAMKALTSLGIPVLRFNFRGTGVSEGLHDHGRGEREDVRAAIEWLDREFHLPLLFAGFSFGAHVGLRASCGDERVKGLISLGTPVHAEGRDYHYDFLKECQTPKLFVSGSRDPFGPVPLVEAVVGSAAPPAELVWVADADHFFAGRLDEMRAAIVAWTTAHFSLATS